MIHASSSEHRREERTNERTNEEKDERTLEPMTDLPKIITAHREDVRDLPLRLTNLEMLHETTSEQRFRCILPSFLGRCPTTEESDTSSRRPSDLQMTAVLTLTPAVPFPTRTTRSTQASPSAAASEHPSYSTPGSGGCRGVFR